MGALTRIMSGGLAGGGDSGGGSANYSGSPLSTIRKMLGRKKKSGGESSGGGKVQGDGDMPEYHKGGKVRKTGPARLRKGEHVLTGRQYRKMKGRSRSRGGRRR